MLSGDGTEIMDYKFLSKINNPSDLKMIDKGDIGSLCDEIRDCLICRVAENGGHLASNLGVVELSVAIHRVFDCPHDHVIFDVGHQSYVHKLLTGRYEDFHTLRQGGGISGFTKRSESEYDCFGAGHSSTSLSAGLGFAVADKLSGSDAYTVVVLGDGAFTGGMVHEALNNLDSSLRLIVILNENEMSISKNIGKFAANMAKTRSKSGYFKAKRATAKFIKNIPFIGKPMLRGFKRIKKRIKNFFYGSNYFEDMGLYYLGPVDGNSYTDVEALLTEAKKAEGSVIIHMKTQKGKGYEPAEKFPGEYHGIAPNGKIISDDGELLPKGNSFSCKMGEILKDKANSDGGIVTITAAMSSGTGLDTFEAAHPDRFFDVGIAEEHAVTFAAALSCEGYKPVFAVYSTFLQRGYDQLIHDVALQNLPVLFCIDRAGLNKADGATHHGIFDVAYLSNIPNFKIYAPVSYKGLEASITEALASGSPCAIRYPSGKENSGIVEAFYKSDEDYSDISIKCDFDKSSKMDVLYVTHGRYAREVMKATERLKVEGTSAGILLCEVLKPYDLLARRVKSVLDSTGATRIILCEEEIKAGGFSMMLAEELRRTGALDGVKYDIVATDDSFVVQESDEDIYISAGVDSERLISAYKNLL